MLPPPPFDPDPSQAPVLDLDRGAMLVTGPPGSGKTALLRERFARLIEGGANPERVALFALDRRAARSAREALVHRLARSLPDVPVFTAHGFAFRVLGRRFEELGYREPPALLSAPEQYAFVRQLLDGESANDWPRYGRLLGTPGFARQLADFVLRAQERLLDADALAALVDRSGRDDYAEAAGFYRRYVDALAEGDRVDFAALLLQAVSLLQRDLHPEEAYEHVMIDDYQDATPAMEGMLRMLAPASTSVVVAADPGGHVFSYRGGSLEPLERIGRTVDGLGKVELGTSHRLGGRTSMLPPLDDPEAPDADEAGGIEVRRFAHPGEEAEAVAQELLRARVEDDVPWRDMAIILRRYGQYLTALRHALTRHGVPFVVVAEAAAVAGEPANRPVIDLFRYVYRPEVRDDLLERLLLTPLCGLDPHAIRRLRREAHLRGTSLRAFVESDELVSADLIDGVERFRSLVRDLPERERAAGPDGAFFWLWSTAPCFAEMVDAPERQRDVDALFALGDVLSRFVERRPGATIQDYLDTLDAAEFGPDPWIPPEERHPNAVRIVSAHRAHGMEVQVAMVVGCVEGEFPSLSHGEPLLDVRALTSPRTARERLRDRLAEERALFRLAVSRARGRTVLTASHSTSARNPRTPSRFARRIGLAWEEPSRDGAAAASLRAMESSLRRTVADPASPKGARVAALGALPLAGAAPRAWWGGREWTDPGAPLHEGEIRTSYSRFGVLENCALQYLYSVEMGLDPERSHSMWLGSLIHDMVDRVQKEELPRSEEALLKELDRLWRPEVFPNRALERQRRLDAEKMIRQFLADAGMGQILESEVGFEFPIDGAVIRGRIDAMFRYKEGGVRVVDYKTSKTAPTQEQVQGSLQLAAYFLAMRRVPELQQLGRPELLELAYLFVEGSDEGYKHCPVQPDRVFDSIPEYEEWAERTILDLLRVVRDETFAPSPEAECMWCSFKPICPLWPEGQEVTA